MSYRYISVVRDEILRDLDVDSKYIIRILLGKKEYEEYLGFVEIDGETHATHVERTVLDRYDHGVQTSSDELREIAKEKFDPDDYEIPSGGDSQ